MKKLLLLLLVICASNSYAQQNKKSYQYIFSGTLLPETKSVVEQHLKRNPEIIEAKIKYKPEKEKGELIFTVEQTPTNGEEYKAFSLINIKNTLLQYNLSPLEIKEITIQE